MSTTTSTGKESFSEQLAIVVPMLTIGMLLVGLNSVSVWIAPALLAISLVGMVVVYRGVTRTEHLRKVGVRNVNYARLAALEFDRLSPWLKENLRGHDAVIDSILETLKKNTLLARPGRTLGNFLLVGPDGTGKVFAAQLLGAGIFPNSEVIQIPLSRYRQAGDVADLTGSSNADSAGGRLTRPVAENPYRVIILEELESACREVHACLNEILETASCRDARSGQPIDFSGSIIIATCKAGVEGLRALASEDPSPSASTWSSKSREILADNSQLDRSFLSRWDGIFLMDRLSGQSLAEIACLQLARHLREYGLELEYIEPEYLLEIVQANREFTEYGVRQMERIIRQKAEPAILQARQTGKRQVTLRAIGSPQAHPLKV